MNKKFRELSQEEKRIYWRELRRKKGMKERSFGLTHGTTSGYQKYKCRCELCKDAMRQARERRLLAKGLPPPKYSQGFGKCGQLRHYQRQVKDNAVCTDCLVRYPHYIMQFDHVLEKGIKSFTIAEAVRNGSININQLKEEIAKCDLVCANCHFKRTYERKKKT